MKCYSSHFVPRLSGAQWHDDGLQRHKYKFLRVFYRCTIVCQCRHGECGRYLYLYRCDASQDAKRANPGAVAHIARPYGIANESRFLPQWLHLCCEALDGRPTKSDGGGRCGNAALG
jgi:hypothetical protein